jgi:hypothetical protein
MKPTYNEEYFYNVELMIKGMMQRMQDLSFMAKECKRGGLSDLADRYTSRMDTCARGLIRLSTYLRTIKN